MNAPHEEAVEFSKISKRENRVYVGNLSYDVKYRDLMEFMRGGGLGASNCCGFGFGYGLRRAVEVEVEVALKCGALGFGDEAQSLVEIRGEDWPRRAAGFRVCGGLMR